MEHGKVAIFEDIKSIYELALLPDHTKRISTQFLEHKENFN